MRQGAVAALTVQPDAAAVQVEDRTRTDGGYGPAAVLQDCVPLEVVVSRQRRGRGSCDIQRYSAGLPADHDQVAGVIETGHRDQIAPVIDRDVSVIDGSGVRDWVIEGEVHPAVPAIAAERASIEVQRTGVEVHGAGAVNGERPVHRDDPAVDRQCAVAV